VGAREDHSARMQPDRSGVRQRSTQDARLPVRTRVRMRVRRRGGCGVSIGTHRSMLYQRSEATMALSETFEYRGKTCTRSPADPVDRWAVGVDLGQMADPTAVSVVRHVVEPIEDSWTHTVNEYSGRNILRQDVDERFEVPHLQRLALG